MRRREDLRIVPFAQGRFCVVYRASRILLSHEVEVDALSLFHRVAIIPQGRFDVVPVHCLELTDVIALVSSAARAAEVLSFKVTGVVPTAVLWKLVIPVASSTECVKNSDTKPRYFILVDAAIEADFLRLASELADTAELICKESISVVEAAGLRVVLIPCTSVPCAIHLGNISVVALL